MTFRGASSFKPRAPTFDPREVRQQRTPGSVRGRGAILVPRQWHMLESSFNRLVILATGASHIEQVIRRALPETPFRCGLRTLEKRFVENWIESPGALALASHF